MIFGSGPNYIQVKPLLMSLLQEFAKLREKEGHGCMNRGNSENSLHLKIC